MSGVLRIAVIFIAAFAVLQFIILHQTPSTGNFSVTTTAINEHSEHEDNPRVSPHVVDPSSPNYTHWCLDMSHNNIYNLGSKLNCKDNSEAFSMSFLLAIMVTIFIEYVTHRIEKVCIHF
jgi:cell division septal protein FtsQ